MRPTDFTISMAAQDVDGLVESVIINGAATLDGALVTGGVGTFATPRRIDVTGTASTVAVNFTVTGTDRHGNLITETFLGPVATATTISLNAFKTITAVSTAATTVGAVTVGEADSTTTQWIPIDHYVDHTTISMVVGLVDSGALTWGAEYTLSDVQVPGFQEGDAVVADVADTDLLAQAVANDGTITNVCRAIRVVITGHTAGGIRVQTQQSGY